MQPPHSAETVDPHNTRQSLPQRLAASAYGFPISVEVLTVAGLVIVAAVLRLAALAGVPPGLHGDEAITALEARRILDEGPIGPWSPSIFGQPAGPFYWIAGWFLVLQETHFTVRLTTALLGIAAVPMFYLFAREMLGRRPALIGAILLVVGYWAIHFSRTAFPLAAVPVVECAALYFLARAVRTGIRWNYVAGGALAGASIYTYGSAPLFIAALSAPTAILLWQARAHAQLALRRVQGLALAGVAGVVAAGPFLVFALTSPEAVLGASDAEPWTETESFAEAGWGERFTMLIQRGFRALAVYFHGFQRDPVDGMGLRGLLDPVAGVLLALGVIIAVRRLPDWRYALLLSGFAAGALPVIALSAGHLDGGIWAEYRRNIIALPFVFALAGVGGHGAFVVLQRWTGHWTRQRAKPVAAGLLALALVAAAVVNIHHYYFSWARDDFTRWVFAHELATAVEHLQETDGQPTVYFYSSRWSYDYPTRQFLLPDTPGVDRSEEFGAFSLAHDPARGAAVYVFLQEYVAYAPDVIEQNPGGTYHEHRDRYDRIVFAAYHLPE